MENLFITTFPTESLSNFLGVINSCALPICTFIIIIFRYIFNYFDKTVMHRWWLNVGTCFWIFFFQIYYMVFNIQLLRDVLVRKKGFKFLTYVAVQHNHPCKVSTNFLNKIWLNLLKTKDSKRFYTFTGLNHHYMLKTLFVFAKLKDILFKKLILTLWVVCGGGSYLYHSNFKHRTCLNLYFIIHHVYQNPYKLISTYAYILIKNIFILKLELLLPI